MRSADKREHSNEREGKRDNYHDNRSSDYARDNRNAFGWSKKRVPTSRSGRVIKGRGVFVSRICMYKYNYPCSINLFFIYSAFEHHHVAGLGVLHHRIGNVLKIVPLNSLIWKGLKRRKRSEKKR